MSIKSTVLHIPFRRLLAFMLILTTVVQLAVISYNFFTGFIQIPHIGVFLFRLSYGVLLSTVVGFLLAYPDIFLINFLNRVFPWNKYPVIRVLVQLILGSSLALIFGFVLTLISHAISSYEEDLRAVVTANVLISAVVNLLIMALLEAWHFFDVSRNAQEKSEALEKELGQIRFEILKNQLNPHFLFNSLNVLSGLIDRDTAKAQEFIDEFSWVYRYVLETIDKRVVRLSEELEFAESYMFLQKIRYGENLHYKVNIEGKLLESVLPPLSLQLLLENAIKHNAMNEKKNLQITLSRNADYLVVENTMNKKISRIDSTGLGQKNLIKRYALITDKTPLFELDNTSYRVKLPIIYAEE